MENLSSIPWKISTKQSRTVSHQCTHWLNMTETLLIEILFTFNNTIKFQVNKNRKNEQIRLLFIRQKHIFKKHTNKDNIEQIYIVL